MIYDLSRNIGYKAAFKRLEFYKSIGASITMETYKRTRTSQQNAALHLYFTQIASFLNNKGITFESIAGLEAPFTAEYIKEIWWRPIQQAMFNSSSTTKLTTQQMNEVFDVISKHLSETTGEYIEFPSLESLMKQI